MSEKNDERQLGTYQVQQSIHVGDAEVLFGEDQENELRYLCCYYRRNEIIGEAYDIIYSDDYLDTLRLFCERVQGQIDKVTSEREAAALAEPFEITPEMCYPNNLEKSVLGKLIAVKAASLRPEYRSAEHQLYIVTGGFGAEASARGTAVFCKSLHNGTETRYSRHSIAGEVKPEFLPAWAKTALAKVQSGSEKPARNDTERGAR